MRSMMCIVDFGKLKRVFECTELNSEIDLLLFGTISVFWGISLSVSARYMMLYFQ